MAEKIEYPLEELAVIKQKKLEESEKVLKEKKELLAKEMQKLQEKEKERDVVQEHKNNKLQQLREKLDEGTTSDKIQQMKQYLKVVDEQLKQKENKVKEQKKVVDTASAAVDVARQDFIKKQQDVEKLSMHRKEWEQQMRTLIDQKEAADIDEIGTTRYKKKKKRD